VVGSALAVDGAVLHAVAFATQTSAEQGESRYPGLLRAAGALPLVAADEKTKFSRKT